MDSILISIRQMLGIGESTDSFDPELIIHINTALSVLTQLGIPASSGFKITGISETWSQLISDRIDIELIKNIVYYRVRLSFDPPQNSFLVDSFKEQLKELEWRIEVELNTSK